ncbi:unnamed protein product [Rotaria magnacalcarata]
MLKTRSVLPKRRNEKQKLEQVALSLEARNSLSLQTSSYTCMNCFVKLHEVCIEQYFSYMSLRFLLNMLNVYPVISD